MCAIPVWFGAPPLVSLCAAEELCGLHIFNVDLRVKGSMTLKICSPRAPQARRLAPRRQREAVVVVVVAVVVVVVVVVVVGTMEAACTSMANSYPEHRNVHTGMAFLLQKYSPASSRPKKNM